jgi:hypothetical protein
LQGRQILEILEIDAAGHIFGPLQARHILEILEIRKSMIQAICLGHCRADKSYNSEESMMQAQGRQILEILKIDDGGHVLGPLQVRHISDMLNIDDAGHIFGPLQGRQILDILEIDDADNVRATPGPTNLRNLKNR